MEPACLPSQSTKANVFPRASPKRCFPIAIAKNLTRVALEYTGILRTHAEALKEQAACVRWNIQMRDCWSIWPTFWKHELSIQMSKECKHQWKIKWKLGITIQWPSASTSSISVKDFKTNMESFLCHVASVRRDQKSLDRLTNAAAAAAMLFKTFRTCSRFVFEDTSSPTSKTCHG